MPLASRGDTRKGITLAMSDENYSSIFDPTAPDLLDRLRDGFYMQDFVESTTPTQRRAFLRRIPDPERMLAAAALIEKGVAIWGRPPMTQAEFCLWATRLVRLCPQVYDLVVFAYPIYANDQPQSGWEVGVWLADDDDPQVPAADRLWQQMRADPLLRMGFEGMLLIKVGRSPRLEPPRDEDRRSDYIEFWPSDNVVILQPSSEMDNTDQVAPPPYAYIPYVYAPGPPIAERDPMETAELRKGAYCLLLQPLPRPGWHRSLHDLGAGRLYFCRHAREVD
jgi:hypothetical protein